MRTINLIFRHRIIKALLLPIICLWALAPICTPPRKVPDIPGEEPQTLVNQSCPVRLTQGGPKNYIYVSDAQEEAVFIYKSTLYLVSKIERLDIPLGVAVDSLGNIYVGNNGRDNIEVYLPSGDLNLVIGAGEIQMPNDIVIDHLGNIYVADSIANFVKVYSPDGVFLRNIGTPGAGEGELRFPSALTFAYSEGNAVELFVADQGNARIQVFDLDGNFLRSFGSRIPAFSQDWQGRFTRLQSLALDGDGFLHAADCYMNKVQILDTSNGDYLDSYGAFGVSEGYLNVPLDIIIDAYGQVIVANSGNQRVEIIYSIP